MLFVHPHKNDVRYEVQLFDDTKSGENKWINADVTVQLEIRSPQGTVVVDTPMDYESGTKGKWAALVAYDEPLVLDEDYVATITATGVLGRNARWVMGISVKERSE